MNDDLTFYCPDCCDQIGEVYAQSYVDAWGNLCWNCENPLEVKE